MTDLRFCLFFNDGNEDSRYPLSFAFYNYTPFMFGDNTFFLMMEVVYKTFLPLPFHSVRKDGYRGHSGILCISFPFTVDTHWAGGRRLSLTDYIVLPFPQAYFIPPVVSLLLFRMGGGEREWIG